MHAQKVRLCKKSRREEIEASIKNGEIKLQERIFTAPEPIQKTVQVTRHGIKADNIGNRMLKMMGWKEGKGLGVNEDGRRENIKVEVDNSRKGIGARTAIKKNSSTKVKFKIHKK